MPFFRTAEVQQIEEETGHRIEDFFDYPCAATEEDNDENDDEGNDDEENDCEETDGDC